MTHTLILTQFATRQYPLTRELLEFLRGQYPLAEHVAIEPPQREALDDFDENYPWAEAAQQQEQQFRAAREAWPDAQLVYAGLAPIPLVFHFGTLLGQTARPTIFQHHHQNRDWRWPSMEPTPDLFDPYPRRPSNIGASGEVLMCVSVSYRLAAQSTATLRVFAPHAYDVGVRRPNPDVLASPADLWALGRQFKQALDQSSEDFPVAPCRHLVASVPVGAALVMGMQVSRTQDLPIQTWNFLNARARQRIRAIEIGEYRGLPQVVLLGASPPDEDQISSAAEIQEIAQILAPLKSRVTMVDRPAARAAADLVTLLYEDPPTVLHLACHGTLADIRLHTQDGWSCAIRLADLERLLLRASKRLQCVVLAACYSAQLAEMLSKTIPAVIGFEGRLGDRVARDFSREFWRTLVRGHSVDEAFADGKLELQDRDQAKLFIRPDIDKPLIPIPE
jgi:hypothetical protein